MNIANKPLTDAQVWSMYWATGQRNSCLAAQSAADQKELNKYWHDISTSVVSDGRIMDLACGNGAVAYALQEPRSDLIVDAIDKSDLNPLAEKEGLAGESKLNFYPNTNILDLPNNLKGYDLICSQFGVEYAGLLGIPEAIKGRLNSKGQLAFLVHHQEGDLYIATVKKLEEYNALAKYELLNLLNAHLVSRSENDVAMQQETYQSLEQSGQQFMDLSIGTKPISGVIFDAISQLLALAQQNLMQAQGQLKDLFLRIDAERNRLQQMTSAAQSKADMQQFDLLLEQQGFAQRQMKEFFIGQGNDKYLLGWDYRACLAC